MSEKNEGHPRLVVISALGLGGDLWVIQSRRFFFQHYQDVWMMGRYLELEGLSLSAYIWTP